MQGAYLEHVNLTVANPQATVDMLCDVFGWKVRWEGPAKAEGSTAHVGADGTYIAVYSHDAVAAADQDAIRANGGLNHVGIVVDDLDAIEKKVLAAGLETHSHADYEPGRRFYFDDANGVEFEVVSYA